MVLKELITIRTENDYAYLPTPLQALFVRRTTNLSIKK